MKMQDLVGKYIRLNDRMGNAYQEYPFYTGESTDKNFYPIEKHKDDYKHVFLKLERDKSINARRCFSLSSSRIKAVKKKGDQIVLVTDCFIVELNMALEVNEITVLSEKPPEMRGDKDIPTLLLNIDESIENYDLGLINEDNLEQIIMGQFRFYFKRYQWKWKMRYQLSFLVESPGYKVVPYREKRNKNQNSN